MILAFRCRPVVNPCLPGVWTGSVPGGGSGGDCGGDCGVPGGDSGGDCGVPDHVHGHHNVLRREPHPLPG